MEPILFSEGHIVFLAWFHAAILVVPALIYLSELAWEDWKHDYPSAFRGRAWRTLHAH